jgi:hypothetical protein
MNGTFISDRGLAFVAQFPKLAQLSLGQVRVSSTGVEWLQQTSQHLTIVR